MIWGVITYLPRYLVGSLVQIYFEQGTGGVTGGVAGSSLYRIMLSI